MVHVRALKNGLWFYDKPTNAHYKYFQTRIILLHQNVSVIPLTVNRVSYYRNTIISNYILLIRHPVDVRRSNQPKRVEKKIVIEHMYKYELVGLSQSYKIYPTRWFTWHFYGKLLPGKRNGDSSLLSTVSLYSSYEETLFMQNGAPTFSLFRSVHVLTIIFLNDGLGVEEKLNGAPENSPIFLTACSFFGVWSKVRSSDYSQERLLNVNNKYKLLHCCFIFCWLYIPV